MNEANIGEVSKRGILSNAGYMCEACGAALGLGEEDKKPHFHYLVSPMQGGDITPFNITVLCPEDSSRFRELDKEELREKIVKREDQSWDMH